MEQIYSAHNINLSSDRGGHFMDVIALTDADDLLNGPVIKALEGLAPLSAHARSLLERAKEKPVSELIYFS